MTIICTVGGLVSITGNYNDVVKKLLSSSLVKLIIPPILWIEYQVIPIYDILMGLQNSTELFSQLYFLEVPDLHTFDKLIKTTELFSIKRQGFQTLIIHAPNDCVLLSEEQMSFLELAKSINLIFLSKSKLFAESACEHIRTEAI